MKRSICCGRVAALTLLVGLFFATGLTTRTACAQVIAPPTTAPAAQSAEELNLLTMGDWGEGKPGQYKVADELAKYVAASGRRFNGLVTAGDNFYVPVADVDDRVWQTLFEKMYDPEKLNFPFYITLGNHDYDQAKWKVELAYSVKNPQSRWKLPSRWYRLDLPAEHPVATFIILDSDRDFMKKEDWNEERSFLERELAKPRAAWTVCVAHHPLFSNGLIPENGVLQREWGELFKKFNVDVYLCGHDHNLQHLEIPGWSTSFVLVGGGGAHLHPLSHDNRGPFSRSIRGFADFHFTPGELTVRYIDDSGAVVHEFVREKAGAVRVTVNTPSDTMLAKPLEALQGIYGKLHPSGPTTGPTTEPTTAPSQAPATQPSSRADLICPFPAGSRILFQGDSITDGNRGRSLDPNHILGHGYQFIVAAHYGGYFPEKSLVFLNRGVSGNTVADLQKRWEKDTLDLMPDYLSILIGVNDLGRGVTAEAYEQEYDALLAQTVKALPNVRLVLGEPFGLPKGTTKAGPPPHSAALTRRREVVARLAAKYHVPVVHYQKVFDEACLRAPASYWIWDGVHPTYSGHQLMADEWIRTVEAFYGSASN